MNYEEMSDFEINKAVACTLGCHLLPEVEGDIDVFIVPCDEPQIFNPCDKWADAGPIIEENKIVINYNNGWHAEHFYTIEESKNESWALWSDDNPRRAAMVVYLKMQEES